MKLGDYKLIFVAAALIGSLLIASSAIASAIRLPEGEQFSELYLLGPERMAENYPSNIAVGQNYSVYVNVANHLASSASYIVYVKLANTTDQLPNTTLGTPSPLTPLYEYRFTISDNTVRQSLLQFSASKATIQGNNSQINTLKINDKTFNVEKPDYGIQTAPHSHIDYSLNYGSTMSRKALLNLTIVMLVFN